MLSLVAIYELCISETIALVVIFLDLNNTSNLPQ